MSAQYPSLTDPPVPAGIMNMLSLTGEKSNGCDRTRSRLRLPTATPLMVRERSKNSSASLFAQTSRWPGLRPKNGGSSRLEHSTLMSGRRTEVPAASVQEPLTEPVNVAPRKTTSPTPRSQRLAASALETETNFCHHCAVSDLDGGATAGVGAAMVAPGKRRQPTIAHKVTRRSSLPRPLVRDG